MTEKQKVKKKIILVLILGNFKESHSLYFLHKYTREGGG